MARQEQVVKNISHLRICKGNVDFDDVLPALVRIKKKVKEIDEYGRYQDVTKLRERANCFTERQIKIHDGSTITSGDEVFWACVCLGLEKVLCKPFECPPRPNIENYEITVTGDCTIPPTETKLNKERIAPGAHCTIPPTETKLYKERIAKVCKEHDPELKVQWPANW